MYPVLSAKHLIKLEEKKKQGKLFQLASTQYKTEKEGILKNYCSNVGKQGLLLGLHLPVNFVSILLPPQSVWYMAGVP